MVGPFLHRPTAFLYNKHSDVYQELVQNPIILTDAKFLSANDFFTEVPYTGMKVISSPVKFNRNPASIRTPAPELGQHTEEVLLELGYSWNDISKLKKQGVIL